MNRVKIINRIIALLLILTIVVGNNSLIDSCFQVNASTTKSVSPEELNKIYLSLENTPEGNYQKYVNQYQSQQYKGETITYDASLLSLGDILITDEEQISISLQLESAGLYVIGFDYQTL